MLFNVLVHLVTETNRHVGHADILREQLDASVGFDPETAAMYDEFGLDATFWDARRAQVEEAARAAASPMSADATELPDEVVEDARLCIYRSLAATGRLPEPATLDDVASGERRVVQAIEELAERRHVVLDGDRQIVLAHPFATRSFGFSVMSPDTLWWGGCAWDSFAIPHLVDGGDVLVATRCPSDGRPLAWVVGRAGPPAGEEVAHFLVPAAHIWDDVVHTCEHQLVFCSDACIDRWLADNGHAEGYRMDLATLWRLASHWYDGRLERGYQRRDPATASDHLRGVGLTGPFWGT